MRWNIIQARAIISRMLYKDFYITLDSFSIYLHSISRVICLRPKAHVIEHLYEEGLEFDLYWFLDCANPLYSLLEGEQV